ncbi:DUF4238 domain-containing protein [Chlorobaculum sp. MV4-Y]|uniref:DUF4238 domain-containing protein n=1 Tax=Chlorobaculum sp. MV4-Y TaxID=2976335 RepID=UPI0039835BEF
MRSIHEGKENKKSVLANVSPPKHINLEKIWNILSHIYSTNIGWSLYADRRSLQFVLLENQSSKQFVTGDQPVINTYGTSDPKKPPQRLEFYYPISSFIALLLVDRKNNVEEKRRTIGHAQVMAYNEHIVRNSHEQLYAATKESLEMYVHL